MGTITARNASLYIEPASGGSQSISGDVNSATLAQTVKVLEKTSFGNCTKQRTTTGVVRDWSLAVQGYADFDSGAVASALMGLLGKPTTFWFGPSGSAGGALQYSGCAVCTDVSIEFPETGAITFSTTLAARSGSLTTGAW